MAKTDCGTFENDLSALIDQELDPARRESVEAHLAACSACRELVDDLRSQRAQFAGLPRIRAPESLAMFIHHRAERRALFGEAEAVPRGRFWLWFARVSASAAIILAGAFVSWRLFVATHAPVAESQTSVEAGRDYENPRLARRTGDMAARGVEVPSAVERTPTDSVPDDPALSAASVGGEVAPPVVVGRSASTPEEMLTEDTIAITCAPATLEQYALLLSAFRQHAMTVLVEQMTRAVLSRNRPPMPEPAMLDARLAEIDESDGQVRGARLTLRVNAAVVPTYLATFEQIAPQCVRVNVPWSRREQIARVLFAQEPLEDRAPVRSPSPDVFAQTLESWLSREFRALRDEALRATSRSPAATPAPRSAGMNTDKDSKLPGSASAGIAVEKPDDAAGARRSVDTSRNAAPELRVPDTLVRMPNVVYRHGASLVQSLFGGLLDVESGRTPPDTILLEIEILPPSSAR